MEHVLKAGRKDGGVKGWMMEEGLGTDAGAGARAAPAGSGRTIICPVGETTGAVPTL